MSLFSNRQAGPFSLTVLATGRLMSAATVKPQAGVGGYSPQSQKVFQYEGQIIRADIVEHVPPDVGAIKMWLGNRRPDKWKEKAEVKLDSSDAFLKVWQAISEGRA